MRNLYSKRADNIDKEGLSERADDMNKEGNRRRYGLLLNGCCVIVLALCFGTGIFESYIPRMTFRFGGTYKTDCDLSIDEYMTNRTTHDLRQGDLRRSVTMVPRLTATSHDPQVRDQLDRYRDTHPTRPMLMEDRRPLTEPPLPGYNGYIPRAKPPELGLGHRYHVACDNGFNAFVQETARHSLNTTGVLPKALERLPREQLQSAPAAFNRRLYQKDGMVPKYTGYIPHRRFVFGNTYGDTTRSLSICSHDAQSYADHVAQKYAVN